MNLKTKLNNRTTATVQMIDDSTCIFSDEVSTNVNCLFVLDAPTLDELKQQIRDKAIECAKDSRFPPRINFIKDNVLKVFTIETQPVEKF